MQKLVEQLDLDWNKADDSDRPSIDINEERATLLYIIDVFNKHLIEIENHPVRKTREILDEFSKEIINLEKNNSEKILFRLRNFISRYRIDECTYIEKTFEDFRSIIWDFVDQLAEDLAFEQCNDKEITDGLDQLKEAVESNSIDILKSQSRQFIDSYIEFQTRKDKYKNERMEQVKKNLDIVKKQLVEANNNARLDHLTGAFNRKSFEEQAKNYQNLFKLYQRPISLIILDIDYFKKINDTYGHTIGDFVLKECVKDLKTTFARDVDVVARIGGEEFAVLLPDYQVEHAVAKAEQAMNKIRNDVYVHDNHQIRFTISMGIAQLNEDETVESWIKRADSALYDSKRTGRNKYTVSSKTQADQEIA